MLHSEIRLGPGVYDNLDDEIYHGDCCEGPSISSTGVRQVLSDPAVYWEGSALNPEVKAKRAQEMAEARAKGEAPKKRHFDKGKAGHVMVLEPHRLQDSVSVVPAELLGANGSLSTKAAKAFAAEQSALGRSVLKPDEWEAICDVGDILTNSGWFLDLVDGYVPEQSHIWRDDVTGVYLKSRPDLTPPSADRFILDVKYTDVEDIDQWVKKSLVDFRLDIQAAFQMWGVEVSHGFQVPGVCYVVINPKKKRVALRTIRVANDVHRDMLTAARLDLRAGINRFADCWDRGVWPSPWDKAADMIPPDFRLRQIQKQVTESGAAFSAGYSA